MKEEEKTRKQENTDKLRVKKRPQERNPTGKGGFGDNPQNRNHGAWEAKHTISFQYRRFLAMTIDELKEWAKTPSNERTAAMDIAYAQVTKSRNSLPHVKEVTDRVEGKAPQNIDVTSLGESVNPYAGLSVAELKRLAKEK